MRSFDLLYINFRWFYITNNIQNTEELINFNNNFITHVFFYMFV